jgi:hypothetical protein
MVEEKGILKKVLYNFSIGNISAILAIIFSVRYFSNPDYSGWGFILGCGLLLYSFLIFLIDQVIKSITQKYLTITLVEIAIILLIYYLVMY